MPYDQQATQALLCQSLASGKWPPHGPCISARYGHDRLGIGLGSGAQLLAVLNGLECRAVAGCIPIWPMPTAPMMASSLDRPCKSCGFGAAATGRMASQGACPQAAATLAKLGRNPDAALSYSNYDLVAGGAGALYGHCLLPISVAASHWSRRWTFRARVNP